MVVMNATPECVAERDAILAEIRRLAAEMGRAPGVNPFHRRALTAKWAFRRYWSRWSDAVEEAGFSPNSRFPKFGEEFLLDRLAQCARHYGRVPTNGDMLVWRRNGNDIPHPHTYLKNFGSKAEAERRLKHWVASRPDCADIFAAISGSRPGQPPEVVGWVYLVQFARKFKIGLTRDISQRIRSIQNNLPDGARTVHIIETDDPEGVEAYWHRRFAKKRTRGEWFKLTPADVAAMKRWRVM